MIKNIILYIGRKKNPAFAIDENVPAGVLVRYFFSNALSFIRQFKYVFALKKPGLLFLGKNVTIAGLKKFDHGKMVRIGNNVSISCWGKEGLYIGNNAWIGDHSVLKVSFSFADPGNFIRIGNNAGIGEFAHLGGAGGLEIGDDCIIGPYLSCHPENHNFSDHSELIRMQGVSRKGIYIGNNCWIGAKVTILDGVTIGNNCIIAAGAVVTRSVPDNSIIGGVPARIIKTRNASSESLRVA